MPVELPDLTPPQAIRNASGLPRRVGEKPYDKRVYVNFEWLD